MEEQVDEGYCGIDIVIRQHFTDDGAWNGMKEYNDMNLPQVSRVRNTRLCKFFRAVAAVLLVLSFSTVGFTQGSLRTDAEVNAEIADLTRQVVVLQNQAAAIGSTAGGFADATLRFYIQVNRTHDAQEVLERLWAQLSGNYGYTWKNCSLRISTVDLVKITEWHSTDISSQANKAANSITNAGEAPDSLVPLRTALDGIAQINTDLSELMTTTEDLEKHFVSFAGKSADSDVNIPLAEAELEATRAESRESLRELESAANATQISARILAESIRSFEANRAALVARTDSLAKSGANRRDEFLALRNQAQNTKTPYVKGISNGVMDSTFYSLKELEEIAYNRTAFGTTSIIFDYLQTFQKSAIQIEDGLSAAGYRASAGRSPAPRDTAACEVGEDVQLATLVARVDRAMRNAGAATASIELVYISRLQKLRARIDDEYPALLNQLEDDLRVARGKLQLLEPLITAREGRRDPQSRADLQTLQGEKQEITRLQEAALATYNEVQEYKRFDEQEAELLQGGADSVQTLTLTAKQMQSQGFSIGGKATGETP